MKSPRFFISKCQIAFRREPATSRIVEQAQDASVSEPRLRLFDIYSKRQILRKNCLARRLAVCFLCWNLNLVCAATVLKILRVCLLLLPRVRLLQSDFPKARGLSPLPPQGNTRRPPLQTATDCPENPGRKHTLQKLRRQMPSSHVPT